MSKKNMKKTTIKPKKKTVAKKQTTPKQVMKKVNTMPVQTAKVKPNKQVKMFLIAAIVLAGLYFFKHLFIVALVNGQPISRIQIVKELEKKQGQMLLDQMISETLINQEAKKRGINIAQSEIDEELASLEESYGLQGGDLEELLKLQGMTKEDLAKQIKIQKVIEKMLADEASVSEEEIDQYIEDNKDFLGEDEDPALMRDQIKDQLTQQKMSEKFQEILENLKAEAKIKYFLEY